MAPPGSDVQSATRFPYRPAARALAAALAFHAAGAAANPQGGVVKAGSATIVSKDSRLEVIQSSQRAVIDWRSFSIGAGGHVNFKQPSAAGATLNRVTGAEMSSILGHLSANGTVFLINPNGILIGRDAKIDVGGLLATTANISNENFMAGRLKFDQVVNRNAVIVNRGEITAAAGGLVALVAPGVENSGVIRAELGRVVLASGNAFTLDLFGDKLVTFAVDDKVAARLTDMEGRPLKAYVNQTETGTIEAGGGSVLIAASAAKAVLDNVINTSGVVRATSFVERRGEIVLTGGDEGVVRVAGTLDASSERASGATGGSVRVLGAEVVLERASRIDVSGDVGGGTALVGGGVQGGGGVPRSLRTTIEAGASVAADAITRGNGGTIVAWSDGETRFAGALSARGGAAGGDGGFVEVSGKRMLSFAGAVDVAAPAGKGGRLLVDPDLLIVDAAAATGFANVLRAGGDAELHASGTIDVQEPIDGRGGAPGGKLLLTADDAILVNNDLVTKDGAVTLTAGAGGIAMGAGRPDSVMKGDGTIIYSGSGAITLTALGSITAQHLVTSGAVTVEVRGPGGTITIERPIVASGKVTIGNEDVRTATTIRLRSHIDAGTGDIDLNGRTWIDPLVRDGNVSMSPTPFTTPDGTKLWENVVPYVAVQTDGSGKIRFRGDVLWGNPTEKPGSNAHRPQLKYIYNVTPTGEPADVLRSRQDPLPTGYYGLYVGLRLGTVSFDGKVGMFDALGESTSKFPPKGTLDEPNHGNGLWVTIGLAGGAQKIFFGREESTVKVARFRLEPPGSPSRGQFDIGPLTNVKWGSPPKDPVALLDGANLPLHQLSNDPNVIGPGPQRVANRQDVAEALPEIPIVPSESSRAIASTPSAAPRAEAPAPIGPQPDAADRTTATRSERSVGESPEVNPRAPIEPTRAADLGRSGGASGVARDAFAAGAPLVPFSGSPVRASDTEYFTQSPFEFVETLARRAGAGN